MKKLLPLLLILAMPLTALAEEKKEAPDPLKQALSEVIQKTTDTVGEAKDFLVNQLPDVIKQLLVWKMITSLTRTLLWMAAFVTLLSMVVKGLKNEAFKDRRSTAPEQIKKMEEYGYYSGSYRPLHGWASWIVTLVAIVGTAICGIGTVAQLQSPDWLEIAVAPKVYLIEYAHDLVKQ